MQTPPSDPLPRSRCCYYCGAPLEERVMVQNPAQLAIDLGLSDFAKEVEIPPEHCPKCDARQPWALDPAAPQKAETD